MCVHVFHSFQRRKLAKCHHRCRRGRAWADAVGCLRRVRSGCAAGQRRTVLVHAGSCFFFWQHVQQDDDDDDEQRRCQAKLFSKMMMNKEDAKPSLLCVLLQPTATYITKETSTSTSMHVTHAFIVYIQAARGQNILTLPSSEANDCKL